MDKTEHERAIMEASECEARESNQWQPIATAPTDGTVIDLWHKDWGRVVDQNYKEGDKFTHWMPLPGAPKA